MVGDQDANPEFLQVPDKVLDFDYGDRVDTGKGLIEQNKSWPGGQGAGDFRASAFAARQADPKGISA